MPCRCKVTSCFQAISDIVRRGLRPVPQTFAVVMARSRRASSSAVAARGQCRPQRLRRRCRRRAPAGRAARRRASAIGMTELEVGELVQVVVRRARVVDDRLQDQHLAAAERRAAAAMDRARGELLTRDHVGRRSPKPRRSGRAGSARAVPLCPAAAAIRRAAADRRGRSAAERRAVVGFEQQPQAARRTPGGSGWRTLSSPMRRHDLGQPRLERGAALGRVEDAGLGLPRPQHLRPAAGRRRAPPPSPAAPPERIRSSGSWPSGRSAKRRLLPGLSSGSARSTAR